MTPIVRRQNGQGYEAARGPIEAYPPPRPATLERPYPPPPGRTYSSEPYGEPSAAPGQPYSAPGQPYGQPYTPPPGGLRRSARSPLRRHADYATSATSRAPAPTTSPPTAATPRARSWTPAHGFFGTVSKGLASVVEYVFQKQGRPNGYILGQDAGGAFVAGLRYGEGILYTKDAGSHRVYWQGPSIGYDAGAEGSKVMMLVYNLPTPRRSISASAASTARPTWSAASA